jgi:hypothetical protein
VTSTSARPSSLHHPIILREATVFWKIATDHQAGLPDYLIADDNGDASLSFQRLILTL